MKIFRRKEDERGVVAVMVAMCVTVILLGMSMAVDAGMQRVKSRDMQGMADVAAMDLSRRLDGIKTTSTLAPTMASALTRSVARNDGNKAGITVSYTLGKVAANGVFTATTSTQVPDAVKVTASQKASWHFMENEETSTRTSIAMATRLPGYDCVTVGSYGGLIGTRGALGLNVFFQDLGQTANFFTHNSIIGRINYEAMAAEEINMTAVSYRLGFSGIKEFQAASVRLDLFYRALYDQVLTETHSVVNRQSALDFRTQAQTKAPSMPMSYMFGDSVDGDIMANMLDIYGGSLAWANATSSSPGINLNIKEMNNSVGHATYAQGPRLHCAKPGEIFSTTRNPGSTQLTMETLGKLDNTDYYPRYDIPGFYTNAIGSTDGPKNSKATVQVDPVTMSFQSVTCENGLKKAVVDLHKGSVRFDAGDKWGVSDSFTANMAGYGNVAVSFSATVAFDATVALAPSTGNVVTATKAQLGTPRYITTNGNRIQWNTTGSTFSSFSAVRTTNPKTAISAADQARVKQAILNALVDELTNPDNPDSFGAWFIAPLIGTAGSTLNGPSIIFEGTEIVCGDVGAKSLPKLVG